MARNGEPLTAAPPRGAAPYRITRWVLIVVGAIAAFLGLFILVGPDDSSVGLGGEVSWQVGEIAPAWGYGLLLAGAALLSAGLWLAARSRRLPAGAPVEAAGWHDVIAHAAVFLVVHVFVWIQDIAIGGGVDYAYFITVPWGIGLAGQALAQAARDRDAQR
jgi:hypothetical protein